MWSRESMIVTLQSVGRKLRLSPEVQSTINSLGLQCLRRRGCRAGRHVRLRSGRLAITETTTSGNSVVEAGQYRPIPTIITTTYRRREQYVCCHEVRTPTLLQITRTDYSSTPTAVNARASVLPATSAPSLYVLNAAALSKPGAVDHLAADLKCCGASVAVITETHFKKKHTDSVIGIDGYTVFRRDRTGRKGGGVALYVQATIPSTIWSPSVPNSNNHLYELLWVRIGLNLFISALYHPPRMSYPSSEILEHIDNCVARDHSRWQT